MRGLVGVALSEDVAERLRLRREKMGLWARFGGEAIRGGGEEGGESELSCAGGSEEKIVGGSDGGGEDSEMDGRVELVVFGLGSVVTCTMPRSSMQIFLRGGSSSR